MTRLVNRTVPVDGHGLVDPADIEDAVTDGTVLISVMAANNEVGTVPDIAAIGRLARRLGVPFHTDAAQAAGHIPLDVREMNVDLLSLSAHKMYGPKGVGALYVRGSRPRVAVRPIWGGGQEWGLRSGTHNVPGIVGFGKAAEVAGRVMPSEAARLREMAGMIVAELGRRAGAVLNGHPTRRLPHNLNLRFPGIDGKAVINSVSGRLAVSAGSACTAETVEPSHVLVAMGLGEERAHSSIRIGLGRSTTDGEADFAVSELAGAAARLSALAGRPAAKTRVQP